MMRMQFQVKTSSPWRGRLLCVMLTAFLPACEQSPTASAPPSQSGESTTPTAVSLEVSLLNRADVTKNWLISPVSITQAVGLAQLGAAGATAGEIESTLGIAPGEPGASSLARQRAMLTDAGPGVTVSIENAIWLAKGWTFRPSFVEDARRFYGTPARTLDFHDARSSAAALNGWANMATRGMIPKMVAPNDINPDTAAFLTNATYFKARWSAAFRRAGLAPFTTGDGHLVRLDMLQDSRALPYRETRLYQAVRVDYGQDERFAMELYIPRPGTSLDSTRRAILGAGLETVSRDLGAAKKIDVDLTMPQFEMGARMDLRATLRAIGVNLPFDNQRADFSGMADRFTYIDKAFHVTRLRVDREGTEAAAVTMLVPMPVSAPPPFTGPRIVVNRPFLLVMRDAKTGACLFTGLVVSPEPISAIGSAR